MGHVGGRRARMFMSDGAARRMIAKTCQAPCVSHMRHRPRAGGTGEQLLTGTLMVRTTSPLAAAWL
jgi:hypothetical protein